jgi:hypothetical protein
LFGLKVLKCQHAVALATSEHRAVDQIASIGGQLAKYTVTRTAGNSGYRARCGGIVRGGCASRNNDAIRRQYRHRGEFVVVATSNESAEAKFIE